MKTCLICLTFVITGAMALASSEIYVSDGLVRSAPGRASDAICEFIKDKNYFVQAVYCEAMDASSPPSTCACKTRKPNSSSLELDQFENELEKQKASQSDIDAILEQINEGKRVEYRDRLFLLALGVIENRGKEIAKAEVIQAEKEKAERLAEEARRRAENAKYVMYTCTAVSTQTASVGGKSGSLDYYATCSSCNKESAIAYSKKYWSTNGTPELLGPCSERQASESECGRRTRPDCKSGK